ncbi:MAG TPA: sigma-54-dependent Fis family transcriptional regulator [Acetobacteraceae bacterium]|nr:sigma-54-dependent Fis family transcriptional regulator [Acetobacteraceae bacterium]
MGPDVSAEQMNPAVGREESDTGLTRRRCLAGSGLLGPQTEAYVIAAWERCISDYHLEPGANPRSEHVGSKILERRRAQLGPLAQIARAEMRRLFGQIAPSHYLLLLTDTDGLILERMCEPGHEELLRRVDLAPGFIWDEQHEGTNGPGTCLHDRRPRLVHREEHFFARSSRMTCSAAPLWGPNGQLLGALDASHFDCSDSRQSQVPTLALVSTSTRIIEQSYFTSSFKDCWILRFHDQAEMVGQLYSAMLAVDEHGRVRAADSTAPARLGLIGYDALVGRSIEEIFDISPSRFFSDAQARPYQIWPASSRSGQLLHAGIWPPQEPPPTLWPVRGTAGPVARGQANLSAYRLGDPVMAHNVWCAERVMGRDIHILLQGETGTGKDTFARAIHRSGERSDKPFIALSCAAIPETLIESELFGYDSGAFTGARAGGMRGKVVAAHGGTLFLDEIGDMPLSLQARLLRLLEEKEVMPLGSSRAITVDLRIISATNRDLGKMVLEGSFRKDLYYRLSGLTLTLPPLRERQDIAELVRTIAAEENAGVPVAFAPEAFKMLLAYRWPGNIRELRNVLATAIALAAGERIEPRHLGPSVGGAVVADMPVDSPRCEVQQRDEANPLATAERERLLLELKRRHWNATATAAALGISRNTLYRKLRKHGVRVGADET